MQVFKDIFQGGEIDFHDLSYCSSTECSSNGVNNTSAWVVATYLHKITSGNALNEEACVNQVHVSGPEEKILAQSSDTTDDDPGHQTGLSAVEGVLPPVN